MNKASSSELARGGGVYIDFSSVSSSSANNTISVTNSRFLSNIVEASAAAAEGGGAYLTLPHVGVEAWLYNTSFNSNRIGSGTGGGTGGGGGGGGLCAKSDGSPIALDSCTFHDNAITAAGGTGGGMALLYSSSAPGASAVLHNSTFRGNDAGGGGSGGGLYFETAGGVSMNVTDNSSFISNRAGESGGGVAITQTTRNTPANLNMKYLPAYEDPNYNLIPALCYDTINASNGTNTFREYDYASPIALFDSTLFDSNRAVGTGGTGGALYVGDLRVSITGSQITSNEANLTGGGIYLESGTAALLVSGTDFISNTAPSGGGTIYSGSAGGIDIQGNTVLDLGGSEGAGITVIAGGELRLEGGGNEALGMNVVQCGMGQNLNKNITVFSQRSNDWVIDCASLTSLKPPSINYTNPTCEQLSAEAPASTDLISCPGLPLTPVMTYTTGTISCSPCATGFYSLSRGALMNGDLRTINCTGCPFGAVCNSTTTGEAIYSKPNFWGHTVEVVMTSPAASNGRRLEQIDSHNEGQIASIAESQIAVPNAPEQRAVFMNCPTGYCCSSSDSCPWKANTVSCP